MRLTFIHNPKDVEGSLVDKQPYSVSWTIAHLVLRQRLSRATPATLLQAFGLDAAPAEQAQGSQTPLSREGSLADLVDGITTGADVYESYVKSSVLLARELRLEPGQSAVVANGRVSDLLSSWIRLDV